MWRELRRFLVWNFILFFNDLETELELHVVDPLF